MQADERTIVFDRELGIEAYYFKRLAQRFPNHFHEHYVIGYMSRGRRRLSCRNEEYVVGPGDMLLFNPLDSHTCEQADDEASDYRSLNIAPEIMLRAVQDITGTEYLPQFSKSVIFDCEQVDLLNKLHRAIMEDDPEFARRDAFLCLIEQLLCDYDQPPEHTKSERLSLEIEAVCDYIEKHYSEHITLDEFSLISNMNRYSLLRAFTRLKGITPYRYLETIRINEARRLLEQGVPPIDAAVQTGFSDQSHFSNFFKEFIGLSPGQYQNIFNDRQAAEESTIPYKEEPQMNIEFKAPLPSEFEDCARVIRDSFITVADDFGLTRENAASNPAFLEADALWRMHENSAVEMYSVTENGIKVGFVAIEKAKDELYYLEKLAVLPDYRHMGCGRIIMDFAFGRVRENGGKKVSIGIINENTVLKSWYTDYGFREKELKTFSHLPFTVCLMEKDV